MVPTHTYTQRKNFHRLQEKNVLFSLSNFFSLSFPTKVFPLLKITLAPWISQNFIQICASRPTFERLQSRWRLFFFNDERKIFTRSLKARLFELFFTFYSFCCLINFHKQISSEILQVFNLFTSLWSSFFLRWKFFSHKIFLLHTNFDRNVSRKQDFLMLDRLNWLLVMI